MLKGNKGITLVALVVTIIVLLILAGVTIALVIGNNGIVTKAQGAQIETDKGYARDVIDTALKGLEVNKIVYGDTYTKEELQASLPGTTGDPFTVTTTEKVTYKGNAATYTVTIDKATMVVTTIEQVTTENDAENNVTT